MLIWDKFHSSVPVWFYKSTTSNRPRTLLYLIGSTNSLQLWSQPPLFTCWCPECSKVRVLLILLLVSSIFNAKDSCFSFLPLRNSFLNCTCFVVSSKALHIIVWLTFPTVTIHWSRVDFSTGKSTFSSDSLYLTFSHYISYFHIISSSSCSNYSVGQVLKQPNSLIFLQVQSAWKKLQTFKNILITFSFFLL